MHFKKENRHMVDILFVISLFCVFAFMALILVIIGADVYKKTISHMDSNYVTRTAYAYISEKVRQNDQIDSLSITQFGDSDALVLSDEIGGTYYYTYLYLYDGSLKELFSDNPTMLGPAAGQNIMDCSGFEIEQITENLYHFQLVCGDKESAELYISTRCQ